MAAMRFYSGLSWCYFSRQPNIDAKKKSSSVMKTFFLLFWTLSLAKNDTLKYVFKNSFFTEFPYWGIYLVNVWIKNVHYTIVYVKYISDLFKIIGICGLTIIWQIFFYIRHHMSAAGSNSLLAMNSENVNLSLQVATSLSRLICPFGGLLNNFRQLFTLSRVIPSFEVIMLSYQ